ncbi:KEOPS complex subunit Pcc1 [Haloplanus pelagicus]|uniref:KEOPS complex subunit Pcc1 n=1 Tax=Haloplanus pelagicus TaxID=2949995 RepID=UPI00203AF409|nr:KEOPS complex subunit Pcc1 [Haloplanus sp. HW8-1]
MSERRACVETTHDDASTVAAALRPDNTPSMATDVADDVVRTTVERETVGGLQSTVDDYVVNLTVAETVARTAREHRHNHE